MKIKEVARYCGLTEKAIRLYESKGLVQPITVEKNGRTFREYDEKCVRDLMTVGILRRAEFSLEQIGAMQKDPVSVPHVLSEYREKLTVNIKNMTAVQEVVAAYDSAEPGIDALADALFVTIGGEEQESERREQTIRWRVWDEDITSEQKQAAYLHFVDKQRKKERAEDILLAAPRCVGGFLGRIWSKLRGSILNERGRVRGGVFCVAMLLLIAIILGGNLVSANKRMAEMERGCMNAVVSSVRELDYLLTNVQNSREYTHDDSVRACFILTQLTDAITAAEGLCGESVNMKRRNDLSGCMGGFLAVSVNGNRIEGILYDGETDECELEFIRRLHADAVAITHDITAEDGLNIRYSAKYKDIREGALAFVDKWCDISLDEGCPYVDIIKN